MAIDEVSKGSLSPENVPDDLPSECWLSYNPSRSQFGNVSLRDLEREVRSFGREESSGAGATSPCAEGRSPQTVFRLRGLVGKGGFGEVWEATQSSLNRLVAVKRLRKDIVDQAAPEDRAELACMLELSFRQEALTTANLSHPNIIPVYELGVDESGAPLIAMKFVRGTSWDEMIVRDAADMAPSDFLARHIPILVQMAQAVAFAHSRGVVHRDLKPSQIIVGEFGEVLLADWGLAVVYNRPLLLQTDDSLSGEFLPTPDSAPSPAGTPAFMAPEQTEDHSRRIGPWTDVYLLGGVLYYLLTLRRPHEAETSRESFLKARLGTIFPPEQAGPNRRIPEELSALATESLEPEVHRRLQSAMIFLERLQDYLSGSSRRGESRVITERIEQMLATEAPSYGLYSQTLGKLARATELWGRNPALPELKRRVQRQFCRAALESGDLSLARILLEDVREADANDPLCLQVRTAEATKLRRDRQRRISLAVAAILMAAIVAAAWFFNYRIETERRIATTERDEAREARDRSRGARDDAHRLVNFMMTDLLESLEGKRLLEPLRQVGDQAIDYFDSLPRSEMTAETEVQHAHAILTNGYVYQALGDSTKALLRFEKYRKLMGQIHVREPENRMVLMELAYSNILVGNGRDEQGDSEAREQGMINAVVTLMDYLGRKDGGGENSSPPAGEFALFYQAIEKNKGLDFVCSHPDTISRVADAMIDANADDPVWESNVIYLYSWMGETLLARHNTAEARNIFRKAIDRRLKIAQMYPDRFEIQFAILADYLGLGQTLEKESAPADALETYQTALEFATANQDVEPARQAAWNAAVMSIHRGMASSYLSLGRLGDAQSAADRSLELAKRAVSVNEQNALLRRQLFVTWDVAGDVSAALGHLDLAREQYEQGLDLATELVRQDPHNTFWRQDLLDLAGDYLALADRLDKEQQTVAAEEIRRTARATAEVFSETGGTRQQSVREALLELFH